MRGLISRTLLRALLRTRLGQQWSTKQKMRIQGSPEIKEKLWQELRKDFMPFLKKIIREKYIEGRSVGRRLTLRARKPATPYKKFLITLTDMPSSVTAAERCIESAKRYGEDYNLEIMPAVNESESLEFFIRHNLTFRARYSLETLNKLAQMGCFASHFKLWRRCVEIGKPIIVLEHDAVFRAPVPALKFKHVIVLGNINWRAIETNTNVFKAARGPARKVTFYPWDHLYGTHAYAVTPEGAHRLIEAAQKELLEPVDWFMRKRHVDILCCHPSLIYCDPEFSTIDKDFRQKPLLPGTL